MWISNRRNRSQGLTSPLDNKRLPKHVGHPSLKNSPSQILEHSPTCPGTVMFRSRLPSGKHTKKLWKITSFNG